MPPEMKAGLYEGPLGEFYVVFKRNGDLLARKFGEDHSRKIITGGYGPDQVIHAHVLTRVEDPEKLLAHHRDLVEFIEEGADLPAAEALASQRR